MVGWVAYPVPVWYKPWFVVRCQSLGADQRPTVNRESGTDNCKLVDGMDLMEVAELKTAIGTLRARVEAIRDWL